MNLIRGLHNLPPNRRGCVATMGAFDGVHRGHQAILQRLVARANTLQLPSVAVIFEPLPREYLAKQQATLQQVPARLMNLREKLYALQQLGVDHVLCIPFNRMLSDMSAEDFVKQVFSAGLAVRYLIVGDDLCFGHQREGNYSLLQTASKQYHFGLERISTVVVDGERVSSSRVRQALQAADFALAEQLLGRPYHIAGHVIAGRGLGRQIQVPTLNIAPRRLCVALSGTYIVTVEGLGQLRHGVANIGVRPTVSTSLEPMLEVHLLDFNETVDRRVIRVMFHQKIRDEQRFASIDALRQRIQQDIAVGRAYFDR